MLGTLFTKLPFLRPLILYRVTTFSKPTGGKKKYPKLIQLPITYHCNSKCVMCNIWQMDWSNEFSIEEFREKMKDPLFSKVKSVGINGGEPTLVKNLDEFAEALMELPELKALNIITHGFNPKRLYPFLEKTYANCKEKGISFHVSISLDGYGEAHNRARGLPVFKIVEKTIDEIHNNTNKYADSYDLGCTVIKQNIFDLVELDEYAKKKNWNIKYRVGIENKRIESDTLVDQFSIVYSEIKQNASEYFHHMYSRSVRFYDKFKYYAIYYWLTSQPSKRLLGCDYRDEGVTIDSRGDIYYCAVASDKIGSLREAPGEDAFFNEKNLEYRKEIVEKDCDNCIHDYRGKAYYKNVLTFLRDHFYEKAFHKLYQFKVKWA